MDKRFKDLSEEEIKVLIKKLDEDLEANPPTPEQAMWYRFAVENRGFEWPEK